ncbi:winged helix-turn-helix domain-containing protein [Nocardiopsis ansamitocini]|uniref:MarR family transcriptional regulator n=1 Tax=Nocardiopsis ansamitocini TaxID=1670832 RepID=A0A9W6P5L8_9ACTN|nr:transcriptional regulator [Nocardiopsis ansamitocini]GLU47576.1 MarR family transcriptional regulator [Nocardiopsis ansamitocini]
MTDHGDLDQSLLNPTRLSIVSVLAANHWAEFSYVREAVKLSDSALSKQVSALDKLGYVQAEKGYVGKRPRTWLNLTDAGRKALSGHITALQHIAAHAGNPGPSNRPSSEE